MVSTLLRNHEEGSPTAAFTLGLVELKSVVWALQPGIPCLTAAGEGLCLQIGRWKQVPGALFYRGLRAVGEHKEGSE